ncbi:MAG: FIST C-terminal domain-containing protein [Planctomycetales bacterium]|nr:FIST C-terminal domain-containing protein [Planctomycetales bacterium]
MNVSQHRFTGGTWGPSLPEPDPRAGLALVFGSPALLEDSGRLAEIRQAFPSARLVGCSTAGEILGAEVTDDTLTCTAIAFGEARVRVAQTTIAECSFLAGAELAGALAADDLRHVLVFAEGLKVNGSQLARGIQSRLPPGVTVTGGLSADGDRFGRTVVLCDRPADRGIVGVGLYGPGLRVGFGSLGGWDPFGPERLVTRATGNVLFELDGEPALDLYRRYLGEHAAGLPASGLRFPLSLRSDGVEAGLVRTLLAIDESAHSITFAGDIPEGSLARLMKANFERLIDGATRAAEASHAPLRGSRPELALLVSCVGRKLVLKQRVEEEVESVREVLGAAAALTGFYSYGELAPMLNETSCQLHNQTMTITTVSEN